MRSLQGGGARPGPGKIAIRHPPGKPDRSAEEDAALADVALTLIENGLFSRKMTDRLRAVLKNLPPGESTDALWKRLKDVESA